MMSFGAAKTVVVAALVVSFFQRFFCVQFCSLCLRRRTHKCFVRVCIASFSRTNARVCVYAAFFVGIIRLHSVIVPLCCLPFFRLRLDRRSLGRLLLLCWFL